MSTGFEWSWAAQSEADRLPLERCGRYELRGLLGRGGFGSVFSAWDPALKRRVAIKLLERGDERALARFQREQQALARLRHPNVAPIHGAGSEGARPYLVMEFVEGRTLAASCDPGALLPPRQVATICLRVAEALSYTHGLGVLHRDLKPQNILVRPDGEPLLVDFGLAFVEEQRDARLSHTGAAVGTPAYMAPEQIVGEVPDARTDVYGLGATLYHALTGHPPLADAPDGELLAIARMSPTPPRKLRPEIPPALESICLRCLEKERADRFPTAAALAAALQRVLAGADRPRSRPIRLLLAAGLALVLGLALALWELAEGQVAPPPQALLAAALEHYRRNDLAPAEVGLRDLCQQPGPLGLQARYFYGRTVLGQPGREAEGKAILRALAADDPAGPCGLTAAAELADWEQQAELADRALALDPDFVPALIAAAVGRVGCGRMTGVPALLERARLLAPQESEVYEALGVYYGSIQDEQAGVEAFTHAIDLLGERAYGSLYARRGQLSLLLERPRRALEDLDRALALDGPQTEVLIWRGQAHALLGDEPRARADWLAAARHDPLQFERVQGFFPPDVRARLEAIGAEARR